MLVIIRELGSVIFIMTVAVIFLTLMVVVTMLIGNLLLRLMDKLMDKLDKWLK